MRGALHEALPEALIADFRESNPIIMRGLDRSTTFLSLVSLIAMIVGALGVAMAMHAHLQQKMDNIAVMKSLGATSRDIIGIYTLQTLMLGLVGGLAGVVVGRVVERTLPLLISRFFHMDIKLGWNLAASAQGIAVGHADHSAVHAASAAGDSQGSARDDSAARHAGGEDDLAQAARGRALERS